MLEQVPNPYKLEAMQKMIGVTVNSCPVCKGGRKCFNCGGTGRVTAIVDAQTRIVGCNLCNSSGYCYECLEHLQLLDSVAQHIQTASYGKAEALLQRAVNLTLEREQKAKGNWQMGGAGAGALVGTLIFPGIGTMLGALAGKVAGEKIGPETLEGNTDWKRADLLFALGVLYVATRRHAEAKEVWIKTLMLNPEHIPAQMALDGRS